jgi:hypothetical protein
MADGSNRDHLRWLRQVAHDAAVTPFAVRIAVGLTHYFNRSTGEAFMSQETLADDLSASIDGVRKAVAQLEDRGHLVVRRGLGRSVVNRYWPVLKTQTASGDKRRENPDRQRGFEPEKTPTAVRENPDGHLKKPPTARPVEPLEDKPPEEPPESLTSELPFQLPQPVKAKTATNRERYKADFDQFWATYPRKVGKKAAMEAFAKARKAGVGAELLLTAASAYAGERAGRDPRYTKHASTWLNGEHWGDEPTPNWIPEQQPAHRRSAVDWAIEGLSDDD